MNSGGVTAGLVTVMSPSGKHLPLLENVEVDEGAPFYTHFFYQPEEAGEHCLSVWGREGCLAEMKVIIFFFVLFHLIIILFILFCFISF